MGEDSHDHAFSERVARLARRFACDALTTSHDENSFVYDVDTGLLEAVC